jgi:hypothetical protein
MSGMITATPVTSENAYTHAGFMAWFFSVFSFSAATALCRNDYLTVGINLYILFVLMGVLAMSLHHYTVTADGDRVVFRSGPLPLFRRSVLSGEIEDVTVGRNWFGWDRLEVKLRRGTLRIGTDKADYLAEFLGRRIGG